MLIITEIIISRKCRTLLGDGAHNERLFRQYTEDHMGKYAFVIDANYLQTFLLLHEQP